MTVVDFGLRAVGLSLALAMTMAGAPARAQSGAGDPMPTASGAGAAPPNPTTAPAPLPTSLSPPPAPEDGAPQRDGKVHGMVEASVGSNGSRSGMVAMDAPLPGGGDLMIAVATTQGGQNSRARKAPQPQPPAN